MAILSNPGAAAETLIAILILGGVFYAIGSFFSEGWSIFGAILGGLLGFAANGN